MRYYNTGKKFSFKAMLKIFKGSILEFILVVVVFYIFNGLMEYDFTGSTIQEVAVITILLFMFLMYTVGVFVDRIYKNAIKLDYLSTNKEDLNKYKSRYEGEVK